MGYWVLWFVLQVHGSTQMDYPEGIRDWCSCIRMAVCGVVRNKGSKLNDFCVYPGTDVGGIMCVGLARGCLRGRD